MASFLISWSDASVLSCYYTSHLQPIAPSPHRAAVKSRSNKHPGRYRSSSLAFSCVVLWQGAWCLQSQHGRAWLAAQHAVEPFPDSVLLSTALAPYRVPRLTRLRLSCDVSAWEVQKGYTYTKQWRSVLFSTTLENVF